MFEGIFEWCRTVVSEGLKWIEQQLLNQTKPSPAVTVVGAAHDVLLTREELLLENALLRQQLVILKRNVKEVQATNTDRGILVVLARCLLLFKPATILAWHRSMFRWFWRRKSQAVGRPQLAQDTIALIKHMVAENRLWGAERIQGKLLKVGIRVCIRPVLQSDLVHLPA